MKYAVLGSGSSANCYVFERDNFSFIVDNGFSYREFCRRMSVAGFDLEKVRFVFLTHVHTDHLKGIETMSNRLQIPVVANTKLNLGKYARKSFFKKLDVDCNKDYKYENLTFTPFDLSHDAPHSIGFHFNFDSTSFSIITDTGEVTDSMYKHALESDILFLESNYCKDMLWNGSYPYMLKKRIDSAHGHLSNEDACDFMNKLDSDSNCKIKNIFLCHLSKNNNRVEKVEETLQNLYKGKIPVTICPRDETVCSE